ncbi:hypothetical protein FC826_03905 [Clostridium botulinum]|uniref:Uncharacterized protein n=2 Tax=Clostridium botulinum TaxID=1491 RepID=A0A6B4BJ67_CLOBO|nr:hypothetical protein [Clostridium botulinum]KRU23845.1 hypothetical protein WG71_36380 [Clostridium sporogenes]ABS42766.1 conserved hypothetical protein [Clostridium botulinum F str. Langeland]ACA54246.1 conserved hypothetical protein [Clostridium botulinum A3 str. Loch Maree]ADG01041.1 conserved hypothetical protein [Clostridium botulinum F str. 230613]KKM42085.1 hypothetical protein VT72_08230 [Clostridium botulinum]
MDKKPYLPKERDFLEQDPKIIKTMSPTGKTYSKLPDNVRDPIVCNNIAWPEFDYTSNELGEDDI